MKETPLPFTVLQQINLGFPDTGAFNASTIAKTLQNEGKPHLIKQILQEEKLKFFSQKLV